MRRSLLTKHSRGRLCHIVMFLACALAGCAQPIRPIFEERTSPIEWPPRPDVPRIRYIGELRGEASLKKPKGWPGLKSLLTGEETTIAFSTPTSVAVRGDRVYVADGQNHALYLLDLENRTIRTIGVAGGRALQWPADVALVEDGFAVADSMLGAVLLFGADGHFERTIGDGALKRPAAVAYDAAKREFWVLDTAQHACVVFQRDGAEVRRFGKRGESRGEFNYPAGIAYAASLGAVVADSMNFRVQLLDTQGQATGAFGRKGDAAGDFSLPRDAAVDSEGHVYVLDSQFENIQVFDKAGRLLMAWGEEGSGPGQFYLPSGLFIDERDRIWVADTYNRRVQVFQYLRETGA